jgi:ribosomal protein S18 acetylase RimI-like enzyme
MQIDTVEADLNQTEHQDAVLKLIDAYAADPMGNGKPLSIEVRRDLIPGLRQHPTTIIFLAYDGSAPVGIAMCFLGFSTFAARPLINIHDLAVLPEYRGRGIGRRLIGEVERKAREIQCCKLTLEVQERNHPARGLYEQVGFAQALAKEAAGGAIFMSKRL